MPDHASPSEMSGLARDTRFARKPGEAWLSRCFVIALLACLLVYFLMRVTLPASLEMDEAEMAYLAQRLRLGYGAQPPLYAWLQWLAFTAFGVNRYALALVKTALMAATWLCFLALAKRLLDRDAAICACASLVWIPEIGWSWLVDRTHTILLTASCCACLWSYFALLHKPSRARYAGFGLLLGLGLLAKYNFALFLAGLVVASTAVAEHRRVVWTRRAGITIAVAMLVFLPHGLWIAGHMEQAVAGGADKLVGDGDGGYPLRVAMGLSQLLQGTLAFAAPLLLVLALVFGRALLMARGARSVHARFFLWFYAGAFALLACIALAGKVGSVRDRWLLPALFSLPLAIFLLLPALPKRAMLHRLLPACAAFALVALLLFPARLFLGPRIGRAGPAQQPYPALAMTLEQRFPGSGAIVAGDALLAGNLRMAAPALHVLTMDDALNRARHGRVIRAASMLCVAQDARLAWEAQCRQVCAQPMAIARERIVLPLRLGARGSAAFDVLQMSCADGMVR